MRLKSSKMKGVFRTLAIKPAKNAKFRPSGRLFRGYAAESTIVLAA